MAEALDALELLLRDKPLEVPGFCVVAGGDEFLKRRALAALRRAVLAPDDEMVSLRVMAGKSAELRAIRDELATRSLLGDSRRMVIVEEADEFVTRNRGDLEAEAGKPRRDGVLVLEVRTFPANTKLAKIVAERGLTVRCEPPAAAKLAKWLVAWCKAAHGAALDPTAAGDLIETIGPELGLLDAELAKLASAAAGCKIASDDVRKLVGGWRTRTAWEMLDAAAAGRTAEAFAQLDRLLSAGEAPVALMGQIGFTLRRFADAARLVEDGDAGGRRISPGQALTETGVKAFVLAKTEQQLRQIGRRRALALYDDLLEADLALKGGSTLPPRVVLERLVARLAATRGGLA